MSMSRCLHVGAVVLAGSMLSTIATGNVLVVAPSGAPYTEIWQAVDAAVTGDIVLVRSGTYGGFFVSGKGIAVIADAGAQVNCAPVLIYEVPDSEQFILAGLNSSLPSGGLEITSCIGSVRVSDSYFGGHESFLTYPPAPPVYIYNCADVAFSGCTLAGADDHHLGGSTGPHIELSNVTFADTFVRGGVGPDGLPHGETGFGNTPGREGMAAVFGKNSTLYLSGCTLVGGMGGRGVDGVCGDPDRVATWGGPGGPAVVMHDSASAPLSMLRMLDNAIPPSPGGYGGQSPCGNASDGPTGGGIGATGLVTLNGASRTLGAIAPAREGQSLQLHFEGEVGDRVFFVMAAYAAQSYARLFHGHQLLTPPLRRLYFGTIGASGVLDVALPVQELGPGIEGRLRLAQAVFIDVNGMRWVSGSSPVLMLDSSF